MRLKPRITSSFPVPEGIRLPGALRAGGRLGRGHDDVIAVRSLRDAILRLVIIRRRRRSSRLPAPPTRPRRRARGLDGPPTGERGLDPRGGRAGRARWRRYASARRFGSIGRARLRASGELDRRLVKLSANAVLFCAASRSRLVTWISHVLHLNLTFLCWLFAWLARV